MKAECGLRSLRSQTPYGANLGNIYMEGPPEAIAAAKAAIDKTLADVESVTIDIHKSQTRFIIGLYTWYFSFCFS